MLHDFLFDGAVDVAAPDGGGGEIAELAEVEACGGICILEEKNEFAVPCF